MLPYTKEDKRKYYIVNTITLIMVFIGTWLIMNMFGDLFLIGFLCALIYSMVLLVVLQYFFIQRPITRNLLKIQMESAKTLDYDPLRRELVLIEKEFWKNPRKMKLYSLTLFINYRVTDGKKAEEFLEEALIYIKRTRFGFLKINHTIELCYYFLMMDDIEEFYKGVIKLKSFSSDEYEKLTKKVQKSHIEANTKELEEIMLIHKLYTEGLIDEELETLLSNPIPYYQVMYTYIILNYYKKQRNEDKVALYQNKMDQFNGNMYPLQRTE